MNRHELLQVLYRAAELFHEEADVGIEVGEHVATAGFHQEDGTIYVVTVAQIMPPDTSGIGIRQLRPVVAGEPKEEGS